MTGKRAHVDELPLAHRPAQSNWSENYLFHAHDPRNGHGVWLHFASPVFDWGLWQDITIVYLPGGREALLAKGYAPRHPGPDGPVGSMLSSTFVDGVWVLRFRGAARRAAIADLHAGLLTDGPEEPVAFELRYHGLSPVWDLGGSMHEQSWANAHWEQPCAVTGWLEYGGARVDIDGSGIRDHSRGSRDFTSVVGHKWLHGTFPGGGCFGVLHMLALPGRSVVLSRGYLVEQGRIEDVIVRSVPDGTHFDAPFEVVLERSGGERVSIKGEIIQDVPVTITMPNHVCLGHLDNGEHLAFYEGQARWDWNGRVGYGLAERSMRLPSSLRS